MNRIIKNIATYCLILPIVFFAGRCNVQPKEHKVQIGHFFTTEYCYFDTVSKRIADAQANAIKVAKETDRRIQRIKSQQIKEIVNPIGELEPYNQ